MSEGKERKTLECTKTETEQQLKENLMAEMWKERGYCESSHEEQNYEERSPGYQDKND